MSPLRTLASTGLLAVLFIALPMHAARAADDAPRCRYARVVELPIRYAGVGLEPAVDGSINGAPATMVVDTGSSITMLTQTAAIRRSLGLHWTTGRLYGIGGTSRLYWARINEIGVGELRQAKHVDMPVIGETTTPPTFDALIGAPFLLQMDLMLDLRAKKLAMYQPLDCDKTDLYLWDETTIVVPFEYSRRKAENPRFKVLVNGKQLYAVIDSGANRSFMGLDAAQRAGIDMKGAGVVRLGDSGGIGSKRAPYWSVPVKRFQIGNETISDAEIGVLDPGAPLDADVYLGQDFLRTHRVLFAMKQEKLYIAYLGGDAFTRGTALEPWMRQEAEAGNADAQYALAKLLANGSGVAPDAASARTWMDKAAAAGQPNARLTVAWRDMNAGHYADAIPSLRSALDQLPGERFGPLWLYIARLRSGQAELARTELEASLKAQDDDSWPYPIAQFYLGKLDAGALLDAAAKDREKAHARTCLAEQYIADWHAAGGDDAEAKTLMASVHAHCAPAPAPAAKVAAQ